LKKQDTGKHISLIALIVTLIMTPWLSIDSLVIPKLILLFLFSTTLIPLIASNISAFKSNKVSFSAFLITLFIVIQMALVVFTSEAPIEQQLFGRTGRGLGFLAYFSLLIVFLLSILYINSKNLFFLINCLLISGLLSSAYSIMQYFEVDFISWSTRTNGIIGTLGNPNFQSALTSIAVIPTLMIFKKGNNLKNFMGFGMLAILIFTIYICQATQGYITAILSIITYFTIFAWFRKRIIAIILFIFFGIFILIILMGMSNRGPLSYFLYKVSVQSRSEFWRTAITTISDNPFFGVGLDSFGDVSTIYKSSKDSRGINEFTDNAHNYFLEYAATGGIPLLFLHLLIVVLTFYCFIQLLNRKEKFNSGYTAIFSVWLAIQSQALISPAAIPLLLWNFIVCGSIIGLNLKDNNPKVIMEFRGFNRKPVLKIMSAVIFVFSSLLMYPFYNSDHTQLRALRNNDANLAIQSALNFPESVGKYNRVGIQFLQSGLFDQALIVGRAATNFNPRAISSWLLILANENAPLQERILAKNKILELDPYNATVRSIELTRSNP
jgi:O-antigen ligase